MFVTNKSIWEVVEEFLQDRGEATYLELQDALLEAGYLLPYSTLTNHISNWKKEGRVVVNRRGKPSTAYIRLAPAQEE